ncbi:hypothetical protein O1611_g6720 [Lasiodiplodia mahajangana]|uniref:Uncharacterized protein n=1 Tax=Lasiodiplodia mahajangana TaxID=1108764 RepID=A0ACC2JHH4_9PEZI|nr:hypothetical protein O1611_g6720 [Lasiodiplodia mahajangana]
MASIKPKYVLSLLSALGLLAQWGAMAANGTLLGLMITAWEGRFPDGSPMRTTWSGIWPLDYVIGLLVAFFYPVLNVIDLDSPAPVLLLTDLLLSLTVFSFMSLVQGQRSKGKGLLRYPAVWQLAWQFFGAATIMPIYLHSYMQTRASNDPALQIDQAHKLPFMAFWAVLTNLPLLLPGIMGASPFIIQLSIVVWFFLPLTTGFIQNHISTLFTCYRPSRANNSVALGYAIVGSVSATVHVLVGLWARSSPDMTWTRMYWPAYSAVQPGSNLILQGATLFCQYGHMSLRSSVTTLTMYTIGQHLFATGSSFETTRAGRRIVLLTTTLLFFGPGAAAAWLFYMLETETNKPVEMTK